MEAHARLINGVCCSLSSGEVGLSDKMAEIRANAQRPGQEVRLADIPADAGCGMGIFEELHGFPDAGALSLHIREESERCHGHAGRLFLERLTEHREEVRDRLREVLPLFVSRICPANADGQVKRVALRFAVCAAAGSLAEDWGIVPWKPGRPLKPPNSVLPCGCETVAGPGRLRMRR